MGVYGDQCWDLTLLKCPRLAAFSGDQYGDEGRNHGLERPKMCAPSTSAIPKQLKNFPPSEHDEPPQKMGRNKQEKRFSSTDAAGCKLHHCLQRKDPPTQTKKDIGRQSKTPRTTASAAYGSCEAPSSLSLRLSDSTRCIDIEQ